MKYKIKILRIDNNPYNYVYMYKEDRVCGDDQQATLDINCVYSLFEKMRKMYPDTIYSVEEHAK